MNGQPKPAGPVESLVKLIGCVILFIYFWNAP